MYWVCGVLGLPGCGLERAVSPYRDSSDYDIVVMTMMMMTMMMLMVVRDGEEKM